VRILLSGRMVKGESFIMKNGFHYNKIRREYEQT